MKTKQRKPRGKSNKGIDMLEGNTSSGPTIVRNNHVGTACEVYDHSSTTHVDCETSAKETNGLLTGMEGTEDDFPWFSAGNIRKWIELELQQPRRAWTIDRYDGAGSFKELKTEPLPKAEAGEDMPPETFNELMRQFYGIEGGLDKLMNQGDVEQEPRTKQWQHWSATVADLCDEIGVGEDEMADSESDIDPVVLEF